MRRIIFLTAIMVLAGGFWANASVEIISREDGYDEFYVGTEMSENADWITAYIFADDERLLYIGEKRGNSTEKLKLVLGPTDPKSNNYKVITTVTFSNGTTKTETEEIKYYSFAEKQDAIAKILDETGKISDYIEVLSIPITELYNKVNNEALVTKHLVDALKLLPNVEQSVFLEEFEKSTFKAALESQKADVISFLVSQGIFSETEEFSSFQALGETSKTNIISTLAKKKYNSENGLIQEFRVIIFLKELGKKHTSDVLSYLKTNNGKYFIDQAPFLLDFAEFESKANTGARREFAAIQLTGKEFPDLDALLQAFTQAADDAGSYNPATPSKTTTSSGGGGGGTSMVTSTAVNTPSPTPAPTDPPSVPEKTTGFVDLNGVEWAIDAIKIFAEEGIVNGISSTEFSPHDYVTREQFVKIIVNAIPLETEEIDVQFDDVTPDEWYYPFVKKAVSLGIIEGYEQRFGVGENITRQDMAVIIHRMALRSGVDITQKRDGSFSDEDNFPDYSKEAINTLYKAGLINGLGEGIYAPKENATRAQAVLLIYNLRENVIGGAR